MNTTITTDSDTKTLRVAVRCAGYLPHCRLYHYELQLPDLFRDGIKPSDRPAYWDHVTDDQIASELKDWIDQCHRRISDVQSKLKEKQVGPGSRTRARDLRHENLVLEKRIKGIEAILADIPGFRATCKPDQWGAISIYL